MSLLGFFSPESSSTVDTKNLTASSSATFSDSLNRTVSRVSNYSNVGSPQIFPPAVGVLDTASGNGNLWMIAGGGAVLLLLLYFLKR
jgi:hypothetical protein